MSAIFPRICVTLMRAGSGRRRGRLGVDGRPWPDMVRASVRKPPQSLRNELLAAEKRLEEQVLILRAGPVSNKVDFQPGMLEHLEQLLGEIREQLADEKHE